MSGGMNKEAGEEKYYEGFHFARGVIDSIFCELDDLGNIDEIASILAHIELAKDRCKLDMKKELCKVVAS